MKYFNFDTGGCICISTEPAGPSTAVGEVITACITMTSSALQDSSLATIKKVTEQHFANVRAMTNLQIPCPGPSVVEQRELSYWKGMTGNRVTVPDFKVESEMSGLWPLTADSSYCTARRRLWLLTVLLPPCAHTLLLGTAGIYIKILRSVRKISKTDC